MREVVVIGVGEAPGGMDVVGRLAAMTRHSVLVRAGISPAGDPAWVGRVPQSTRFHQERRAARVDSGRCVGCGRCFGACVHGALGMGEDGVVVVDASLCNGCGKCVASCRREALALSVMTDACCRVSSTDAGRLVEAELAPEGRVSEGLVFALKEEGRRQARMIGADVLWVDASTCPESLARVAVAGADAVLVLARGCECDALADLVRCSGRSASSVDVMLSDGAVSHGLVAAAEGSGGSVFVLAAEGDSGAHVLGQVRDALVSRFRAMILD